jgi:redox-sensitive bicupin YhaK (pirin superfamily)
MNKTRTVKRILTRKPTLEGAGVHLFRVFGNAEVPRFDPFLLLDDFRSDNPDHYQAGFPWHPHRGIETVTYMLRGRVEHGDSLGNAGVINRGDIQWMTAGSGIIHQEMPKGEPSGHMGGLQLWINLPAQHKMMPPRYRGITAQDVAEVRLESGAVVRVIAGEFRGVRGPVQEIMCEPKYLDVTLPAKDSFVHEFASNHTVLAYVLEGQGRFHPNSRQSVAAGQVVLYGEGASARIDSEDGELRFLLISGKPFGEPVAWFGPIVMNTEEELEQAFAEYRAGTFLKHAQAASD